jgi:hypothetical protein
MQTGLVWQDQLSALVIGRPPDGTDRTAGRIARLCMGSDSDYEIVFD